MRYLRFKELRKRIPLGRTTTNPFIREISVLKIDENGA